MSMFKLKYLWVAEFSDGSVFFEPSDDHSELDNQKSSFYDLLQMVSGGKTITKFTLKSRGVFPNSISVSLKDGCFEVNGTKVYLDEELPSNIKRELIFYRQHYENTTVSFALKAGQVNKITPGSTKIRYTLGWKSTIGKRSFKYTMAVE